MENINDKREINSADLQEIWGNSPFNQNPYYGKPEEKATEIGIPSADIKEIWGASPFNPDPEQGMDT